MPRVGMAPTGPEKDLEAAFTHSAEADVFFAIGSSLRASERCCHPWSSG